MTTFYELSKTTVSVSLENAAIEGTYAIIQVALNYKFTGALKFDAAAEYDSKIKEWSVSINDAGNEYYEWEGVDIDMYVHESVNQNEYFSKLANQHKAEWTRQIEEYLAD